MNKMRVFSRRVCAGIASVATLLAGMALVTTASAATYTTGEGSTDDFRAGEVVDSVHPQLTVTKYLSIASGNDSTGSSQDQNNVQNSTPAQGVVFSLTEIEATENHTPEDFTNSNGTLDVDSHTGDVWHAVAGTAAPYAPYAFKAYGVTDANGVINSWQSSYNATTHVVSGSAVDIPTGHKYYVLHEEYSPHEADYAKADDSIFDLPYHTTNVTDAGVHQDGYVYHLHVYPKNVSKSPLHKTLISSTGNKLFAQVGDVLTYDIVQKIYTNAEKADADKADPHTQHLSVGDMQDANNTVNGSGSTGVPALKIVDRLSSAFEPWNIQNNQSAVGPNESYTNSYSAYLSYKKNGVRNISTDAGSSGGSYGPNDTGRLQNDDGKDYEKGDSAHMMFGRVLKDQPNTVGDQGQNTAGNGTHYMSWYFFRNNANYTRLLQTLSGSDISDIELHITLHVKVTNLGDSASSIDGRLTNDVASDVRNSPNPPSHDSSHTPSAGFQFAKTASDSMTPLDGAVFRLTQTDNSSMYLSSDGQFHPDSYFESHPDVKPMTAMSNNLGIVSFTGLPVLNSARNGWNTAAEKFDVYEYAVYNCAKRDTQGHACLAYNPYTRATVPFKSISFSDVMSHNYSSYVASLNNDSRILPDGWAKMENQTIDNPVSWKQYPLQFGEWSVDYDNIYNNHRFRTVTATAAPGQPVYEAMKNFLRGEKKPMQLPLTGGIGIALLLLAGAAIIAIVDIERKRRLNAVH